MEAPRDGVLINSMLKHPADISKLEISICNYTMLQSQQLTVIIRWLLALTVWKLFICIVTATLNSSHV